MRWFSLLVFLIVAALCMAHIAYIRPLLPDQVASHFDGAGRPDAWSSRTAFINGYMVVVGITVLLFLGLRWGIYIIPPWLVNLPRKDYWLSEDRFGPYFLWFGTATLLLVLDMMHQTFLVNVGRAETLPRPMTSIGVYLGFTVVWVVLLYVLPRWHRA